MILDSIIDLASISKDLHVLMKIHNMKGVLTLNKRDFLGAIKEFKKVRDAAEEAQEDHYRL